MATLTNSLRKKMKLFLGPGGLRGCTYIGLLIELRARQVHVSDLIGCSAGAICGLMLCLGLTDAQMVEEVSSPTFDALYNSFSLRRLMTRNVWSYVDSSILEKHLQYMCSMYAGDSNVTFETLKQRSGIDFTVVVSPLGAKDRSFHGSLTTPNIPVVKSVLASAAVPFLFAPVEIDGISYLDGALTDMNSMLQYPGFVKVRLTAPPSTLATNFFTYASAVLNLVTNAANTMSTSDTIDIKVPFRCHERVNESERLQMIQIGRQAARDWFNKLAL